MNLHALPLSSHPEPTPNRNRFQPSSKPCNRRSLADRRLARLGFLFLALIALGLGLPQADAEVRLTIRGSTPAGEPQMELSGSPSGPYRIDASSDLVEWTPILTNQLAAGPSLFTAPGGIGVSSRFFRAVFLESPAFQPGIVLLRFKNTANDAGVAAVLESLPLQLVEEIYTSAMDDAGQDPIYCMHTTLPVEEAVQRLRQNPAIDFAEPNYLYSLQSIPNDPKFTDGSLWGMFGDTTQPANAFGSQAAEAWLEGYRGSRQVYVGIIDQGVQFQHPDLAGNFWTNPFDPPNGRDDDNNGYVDDAHGWDFYGDDNSIFDGLPDDVEIDAHGTHVAGTVGATGNNGLGVVGVNWEVTMISAKIFGAGFAGTDKVIRAIDYFTDLKRRHGLNIVALNNSWGGRVYSRGLHEAIIRSANAGILFICAAGNLLPWDTELDNDRLANYPSNYDTTQGTASVSPAPYDSVISVAAIDRNGGLPDFSHFGATTVDLGAPGVDVWSSVPWHSYASKKGTSMATPHVTGAAALYASTHPGASAAQIRTALLGSTISTPSLAGKCVTGGRLNLSAVIRPDPTTPPPVVVRAPANLRAVSVSTASVSIAWDDRSDNEEGFQVQRSLNGVSYSVIDTVGANSQGFTDHGVLPAQRCWYRVRAFKSPTNSAWSNVLKVTTPTPIILAPAAPSNLRASLGSDGQVQLAWQDNAGNESGFRIERATGGGSFGLLTIVGANVTTYSDTTATKGYTYTYRIRAYNSVGNSSWAVPITVPVPIVSCLERFVDASYRGAIEDGSSNRPFRTLGKAVAGTCAGAVVNIRPGVYRESSLISGHPILLQPRGGVVTIVR